MVVFFTEEAPEYVLVLSNTEAILLVGKTTNHKLIITRMDKTIDWTARVTYPRGAEDPEERHMPPKPPNLEEDNETRFS